MWVILVGKGSTLSNTETRHKVVTVREYLSAPDLFRNARPKIINLAASYSYQSRGYYASLLAGARGHRVLPSVETLVDLSEKSLYENALPELEHSLNRALGAPGTMGEQPEPGASVPERLTIHFGTTAEKRFERFARLVFDWFRAPAIEVMIEPGAWSNIRRIQVLPFHKLQGEERARFLSAMEAHTGRTWREARNRVAARYSIAVLCDRNETLPPSSQATLKHWARIAGKMGVAIEPIGKRDLPRLANHDALFIRETTSISNHTYRFARRAQQEGMPVIDDPVSMIRCTNKVYLHELLGMAGIAMPRTRIVSALADLDACETEMGYPMVVKIPDGSFSRGVRKASNRTELDQLVSGWLRDTDLLIVQEFMPTEFDWRVGVLDGEPLFVSQYTMAKKHWQIVNHEHRKGPQEGGFRPVALADAPAPLLAIATRAANLIGRGLYGVDVKEARDGFFVIEINDNPNLDHGVEDAAEKELVWKRLTEWFIRRIDRA